MWRRAIHSLYNSLCQLPGNLILQVVSVTAGISMSWPVAGVQATLEVHLVAEVWSNRVIAGHAPVAGCAPAVMDGGHPAVCLSSSLSSTGLHAAAGCCRHHTTLTQQLRFRAATDQVQA